MAFTYTDDLSTDRAKVRFYLQDTVEDAGPRPGNGNFSDAEIDGLIVIGGSWQRAVAAGYESLAAAWATYVDRTVGPRKQSLSQIAARWAAQATAWRAQYGLSAGASTVVYPIRIDGYSQDIAADEV